MFFHKLTNWCLPFLLGMLYNPYTIGFIQEFAQAIKNITFCIVWSTLFALSLSIQYLQKKIKIKLVRTKKKPRILLPDAHYIKWGPTDNKHNNNSYCH